MNIVVTGSKGFVGRNLVAWLNRQSDCRIFQYDLGNNAAELTQYLAVADLVFHLAGVNRPQSESEFQTGNVDFTAQLCNELLRLGRPVPVVLSSSIQATLENPYGISKRQAEAVISHYALQSGAKAVIYRLQNVFGKWCRPNYNSVVATFCYNIAHDLPITISDPTRELQLIHVDDVVAQFLTELPHIDAVEVQMGTYYRQVAPIYRISLGQLAELIRSFRESRQSLLISDLHDEFKRKLYGTY
jgi:UDP-2-acetamido-2,6-beta-L-arabino-hexul-4-ose reductase